MPRPSQMTPVMRFCKRCQTRTKHHRRRRSDRFSLSFKCSVCVGSYNAGRILPDGYHVWSTMWQRCTNAGHKNWIHYGGRGIWVTEQWRSFERFMADVGPRPSPNHQIDRIDNDGPYSPENCRWVTRSAQARNRRDTVWLTAWGETKTRAEWIEDPRCRVGLSTLRWRLARGWSVEEALS